MSKNIKEIIYDTKKNPEFSPDSEFLLELRSKLSNVNSKSEMKDQKKTKLPVWRIVSGVSLLFLIGAGIVFLAKPNLKPKVTVAYALEEIKQSYDEITQPGKIFHKKTVMKNNYDGEAEEITYEVWEDLNSQLMRNIVEYNNTTVYQINDGEKYWDYDSSEKYLRVEIVSGQENLGTRVIPTLGVYEQLFGLDEEDIELSEEEIDGESYYVFTTRSEEDIEESLESKSDTDLSKYYFEKETFILKIERYYIVNNDGEELVSETVTEVIESLDLTEDQKADLFSFDIDLPDDVKIEEVDQSGYDSDLDIQVDTDEQISVFENEQVKFVVPDGWKVIDIFPENSGIAIEKNDYFLMINTDVIITGGGWGYEYDGICPNNRMMETTLLENGEFERVDEIISLVSNGQFEEAGVCNRVNLRVKDNQVTPFWASSMIKVEGSEYPIISREDLLNQDYEHNKSYIIVKYGYKYSSDWEEIREYPSIDDAQMKLIRSEMDAIVNTIEFYK
jgi:hypothetical protein